MTFRLRDACADLQSVQSKGHRLQIGASLRFCMHRVADTGEGV